MKVTMNGDSVTYYADYEQHVVVYQLAIGETVSVESGCGVISQKGLATSTLTGTGNHAYVAVLSNGNPIVLSNVQNKNTISVDPDAVICWMGQGTYCDPQVKTDISWKNFIGQASGESYAFEWNGSQPVSVVVQPSERRGGIRLSID